MNKSASEAKNRKNAKNSIMNKISYFLLNSRMTSLIQKEMEISQNTKSPKNSISIEYEKCCPLQQCILNINRIKKKMFKIQTTDEGVFINKQKGFEEDSTNFVERNAENSTVGLETLKNLIEY